MKEEYENDKKALANLEKELKFLKFLAKDDVHQLITYKE